jgi:hypothetical protein
VQSNALSFTVTPTPSISNGYAFRHAITIDHTKVPNTDQSNFPVLVSGTYSFLSGTAYGGDVTSSAGYDIAFASDSAGSNALPFEQESYSASTGAVNYWVKVPTLSRTTDTVITVGVLRGSLPHSQHVLFSGFRDPQSHHQHLAAKVNAIDHQHHQIQIL